MAYWQQKLEMKFNKHKYLEKIKRKPTEVTQNDNTFLNEHNNKMSHNPLPSPLKTSVFDKSRC